MDQSVRETLTYIRPIPNRTEAAYLGFAGSNGVGPAWVKIFNSGHFDGTWATEKLRNNQGKVNFLSVSDR